MKTDIWSNNINDSRSAEEYLNSVRNFLKRKELNVIEYVSNCCGKLLPEKETDICLECGEHCERIRIY